MNKKSVSLLLTLLVLFTTASTFNSVGKEVETKDAALIYKETIYVDANNTEGPWDGTLEHPYQYIQDGIDNATEDDIVFVFNGIYHENVMIDKNLSIIGENKSSTIVDGMYNEFVIQLIEDNVSIENFTIRNSGGYTNNTGIKLDSENNIITNCIFYRTKTGIYLNKTNYNEINNCTFYTNGEGIYLTSSQNNIINNCYLYHNALGIHLQSSNKTKIKRCYAVTNGIAYYLEDSTNIQIEQSAAYNSNDNQAGFFLNSCSNINILNCHAYHNGVGVKISNSSNIYLSNSNILWNTHYGIKIKQNSKVIKIENNEIANNLRFGIESEGSQCSFHNNNIYKNLFGINSEYSCCNARKNWWGSPLGPALFERKTKDRIFFKHGRIKFFPWQLLKNGNAGSNWQIDQDLLKVPFNNTRFVEIELPGQDSDQDYIPDWWEEKWGYNPNSWDDHKNLDPDNDALNNIEECYTDEWGSNPFHKDIFIEFDWVKTQNPGVTNKPPYDFICQMKSVFVIRNITLHIDDGSLGGGEEIPFSADFSYADLRDLYWDYFLHNDLNNPRKGIFRYCIVTDYGPGGGFAFFGWDHLDSFEIAAQRLQERYPMFSRGQLIVGGAIHELGHTLGLNVDDHGGNDNSVALQPLTLQWWKYRNYKSCMNYRYTYKIIDFSDGSHGIGDFDDWSNLDFTFFRNTHFKRHKN